MKRVIKVNVLYKELLSRGFTGYTFQKVQNALNGKPDSLTIQEKAALKKLLTETHNNLTKTIKLL